MLEKVQADRQAKLDAIREMGFDPYGRRYENVEPIPSILERYEQHAAADADAEEPAPMPARTAGRIVLLRDMGKMIFAHLRDATGQMQIALRKNAMSEELWALAKLLDLGDVIGVAGPVQKTRTGEVTIWADEITILCKGLLPMPEKFHGLSDIETRTRQRYLDLMTNPDSARRFRRRVKIIEHIRRKLNDRNYLEVETPVLQPIYGGAAARPFTTHHNTLHCDLFLRISPELYLKRLLVGGMERVYEFSRNFRNEGIDASHNPEFTLLELYEAYADYNVMMEIAEDVISTAAATYAQQTGPEADRMEAEAARLDAACESADKAVAAGKADAEAAKHANERRQAEAAELRKTAAVYRQAAEMVAQGKIALPYGETVIDYTTPWRRAKYADLLEEHAGVKIDDVRGVREKARQLGIAEHKMADAVVVNEVFEATAEPTLDQPTFVCDYPAELCPLTRRDPNDPNTALRFELFIAHMEIANAYTELNDPAIQKNTLTQQLHGEGDETMRVMDEDFVTALMHGMPPAGGMGVGVDRVVMLLSDTASIRDVILFPLLKPEVVDGSQ
jgi:lysyl-tRNA synthetase class 2